ncbi:hypothetical protein CEXT_428081 [Caerostris extrusa]|uniref:Uncharacterized protein n=1 Tax=Caerostris extrusa TaxID=172846 RepID=A0AAV4Y611_CAEEX|nr:hypothetical protein CEXT_428081 [Caerostris extrusa]
MTSPELMDTTCAEGAGPFQDHLMKATNGGNQISAEEQARINCGGLRHLTEQLEKHKKIFLQVKETCQAIVKTLQKDQECNAM